MQQFRILRSLVARENEPDENVTSSTKPEVHNVSQRSLSEQLERATDTGKKH